jgi:hypothetical protein
MKIVVGICDDQSCGSSILVRATQACTSVTHPHKHPFTDLMTGSRCPHWNLTTVPASTPVSALWRRRTMAMSGDASNQILLILHLFVAIETLCHSPRPIFASKVTSLLAPSTVPCHVIESLLCIILQQQAEACALLVENSRLDNDHSVRQRARSQPEYRSVLRGVTSDNDVAWEVHAFGEIEDKSQDGDGCNVEHMGPMKTTRRKKQLRCRCRAASFSRCIRVMEYFHAGVSP